MTTSMTRLPLLLILPLTLAACTSTDPTRVERDFGNSVRQMIEAQLYDPEAAAEPDLIGLDTLDGPAAASTIDNYRKRSAAQGTGAASSASDQIGVSSVLDSAVVSP